MKLAYHTIIFGPLFRSRDDLERALLAIADAGFSGVELMQRPDGLGLNSKSYAELSPILEAHNLTLIGLAGGSIQDRVEFLGEQFTDRAAKPYLYVEDWRQEDEEWAGLAGCPLALHAHYFKKVHSLDDARPLLSAHPELLWVPDTAHLYISGDDVCKAIQEFPSKLAAVHLKDWTPSFGRVSHRYARGFTELGKGEAPVEEVLELLIRTGYSGWVVVEQDATSIGAEESIWEAAEWLAKHGAPIRPKTKHTKTARPTLEGTGETRRLRFLERLNESATRASATFYKELAVVTHDLYDAEQVAVWAYSEWNSLLTLAANSRDKPPLKPKELPLSVNIHEIPLQRMGSEVFCLDETNPRFFKNVYPGREYPFLDHARQIGASWLLSLPIFSPFNPNHTQFLLNVLAKTEDCLQTQDPAVISLDIARALDVYSNELFIEGGVRANNLSSKAGRLDEFLQGFVASVRDMLGCEGCTILLQNLSGTRLEARASVPGLTWRQDLALHDRYYRPGDGSITVRAFERREPRIYGDVSQLRGDEARPEGIPGGRSAETVASPERDSVLLAPIVDRGNRVLGVLRCRNKGKLAGDHFTDDDLAKIDSFLQVAVPHLVILRAEEGRIIAFRQMKHELKNPIIAVRGVLDNLRSEINLKFHFPTFERDYFADAFSWMDLMLGLFGRLELMSQGQDVTRPRPGLVNLKSEIIAPVIRQFNIVLIEKQFSKGSIRHGVLEMPKLKIDKTLFQQVAFNLIDNAVKYSKPNEPKAFRVWIDGQREDVDFIIRFQDWGLGVENGMEEAIF